MKLFVEDQRKHVSCTRIDVKEGVPTTRWGHAAAVMDDDKLLILGGRNEEDINDIYCFNNTTMSWKKIEVGHPIPKPRRRLSCILVSKSLVMFGGFDGNFFNDLHSLDMKVHSKHNKFNTQEAPSTKDRDFYEMINDEDYANFFLRVHDAQNHLNVTTIHINKSLLLYRLLEKEVPLSKKLKHLNLEAKANET